MTGSERTIDGAIGEGWSGRDPDGCHVNVVLAQRGSVTAAALMTAFTTPRQGHSPILVCVGADKDHYEPIWPPTVMMNKATMAGERHAKITYGATQLGVGQGVLDAVADDCCRPPTRRSCSSPCGSTPARATKPPFATPPARPPARRWAWRCRGETRRPRARWWSGATRCATRTTRGAERREADGPRCTHPCSRPAGVVRW